MVCAHQKRNRLGHQDLCNTRHFCIHLKPVLSGIDNCTRCGVIDSAIVTSRKLAGSKGNIPCTLGSDIGSIPTITKLQSGFDQRCNRDNDCICKSHIPCTSGYQINFTISAEIYVFRRGAGQISDFFPY